MVYFQPAKIQNIFFLPKKMEINVSNLDFISFSAAFSTTAYPNKTITHILTIPDFYLTLHVFKISKIPCHS